MSFNKIKPAGWAVNEKLTSAQMNALDTDHANAIDKTGDTVEGVIEFDGSSGGFVSVKNNAYLSIETGSSLILQAGSSTFFNDSVVFQTASNVFFDVGSSLTTSAGVLSTFGGPVTFNDIFTANGTTNFNGTVAINNNSLITAPSICSSSITCNGGTGTGFALTGSSTTFEVGSTCKINCNAGSTLEVKGSASFICTGAASFNGNASFSTGSVNFYGTTTIAGASNKLKLTTRTIERIQPYTPNYDVLTWYWGSIADYSDMLLRSANNTASKPVILPLRLPYNSVLKKVTVTIQTPGSHIGFPQFFPSITLLRRQHNTNFSSLITSKTLTAADFSNIVANYDNNQISIDSPTITTNIDTTLYHYYIRFNPETGTNALQDLLLLSWEATVEVSEYSEYL